MNTSHLDALELNLSHERSRLAAAKSQKEIELRTVYVSQLQKEIAGEMKFLGIEASPEISDDDLFAALS